MKRKKNSFCGLKALDVENGFRTLLPLLPGDLKALVIRVERADDASSDPRSVLSLKSVSSFAFKSYQTLINNNNMYTGPVGYWLTYSTSSELLV